MPPKPCPHCGFTNFDVSAYCARCTRPLDVQAVERTAIDVRAPQGGPRSQEKTAETVIGPPRQATLGTSRMPAALQARRAAGRPGAAPKRAAPPTPQPGHEEPTTIGLPPLPPLQPRRPQPRQSADPQETPTVVRSVALGERLSPPHAGEAWDDESRRAIPVLLPHVVLLWVSALIDLGLGLGVLLLAAVAETSLFSTRYAADKGGAIENMAQWVHVHGSTMVHAVILACLVGVLHGTLGGRNGRTVGRRLCGLYLVGDDGSPLSWGRSALRSLLSLLSLACAGAGYLWAVVDGRRRAWHDIATGAQTVVRA